MIEEWKEIKGFNEYLISNYGNIKRKDNKEITIILKNNKARSVYIKRDLDNKLCNIQISKLVAMMFVENPKNYNLVFHIDKDLQNDNYINLIWKTDKNRYIKMNDYYIGYDINDNEFYFDIEDYEIISKYQWYIKNNGYVFSSKTKKHDSVYMHKLLIKNDIIDHINRNRIDNRKENLRAITIQQNNFNQSIGKGNTSGLLGVAKRTQETKKKGVTEYWKAQINYNDKHISKQFKTKEDAIKWRLQKELEYYGIEFAPQRHLFEEYAIK